MNRRSGIIARALVAPSAGFATGQPVLPRRFMARLGATLRTAPTPG